MTDPVETPDRMTVLRARLAARMEVATGIGVFLAAFVLSGIVFLLTGTAADETDDAVRVPAAFRAMLVAYVVVVPCALAFASAGSWRPGSRAWLTLPRYLLFLLVWIPVAFVLQPLLLEQLGVEMAAQPHLAWFATDPARVDLALALVTVVIAGPLFEELVFRGYLLRGITGMAGPRAALWITAVLFGLIHVDAGIHTLLPLTLLGAFFAWLRQRTGTLFAPVLAHAIHNAWTVGVALAAPRLFEATQTR
ncbi:MAG: CPBP family intramembrane metalloprotease [Planctomycetes bacterium]|nr:CPBP family intramembrane metalloprotease [Planctomycetota bacterium]